MINAIMPSALTERQMEFVQNVARGFLPSKAAATAGYLHPYTEGTRLMRLPHVVQWIKMERDRLMQGEAGALAYNTLVDIMSDKESAPAMVRFQCAKWVMECNGHVPQTAKNLGLALSDKPLTEMTPEELRAFVDTGRKALEVIENTATNVTPAKDEA